MKGGTEGRREGGRLRGIQKEEDTLTKMDDGPSGTINRIKRRQRK